MTSGDLFGGLFDFNGDGKTDSLELFVGYQALQDTAQRERDNEDYALDMDDWDTIDDDPALDDSDTYCTKTPVAAKPNSALKSSMPVNPTPPVPNKIDSVEYEKLKNEYKKKLFSNIKVGAVLSIFPFLFIVIALDMYNPRSYDGNGTAIIIAVLGIVLLAIDIIMLNVVMEDDTQRFKQVKEAHRKWEKEQVAVEK